MAPDQEIAKGVESVLRQSDPNAVNSLNGVVQQVEAKLDLDLLHKAGFMRDQINSLLRSHPQQPQPPPPQPQQPPQQQQQPPKDHFALHNHPQFQSTHHHQHQQHQQHQQQQQQQHQHQHQHHHQHQQFPSHFALQAAHPHVRPHHQPLPPPQILKPEAFAQNATPHTPKESAPVGAKRRGGLGGLNKVCGVSPELQAIFGELALPRTEILKQLWAYIRQNNLQDPSNKRKIICDNAPRVVFEIDCTVMFKMHKLLAKHIIALEPTKELSQDKRLKVDVESTTESVQRGSSPVEISEALAKFLGPGGREMPQSEAIKLVWEYIKVNCLEEKKKLKIAIIDSGIECRCESFLREERKELSNCPEDITITDTIIGKAVYFPEIKKDYTPGSALGDVFGHGTYCAAIAAGRKVKVSLYGTFPLFIEGAAAEEAEVYSYKVIWESDDCIIKKETIDAFRAAIEDEVDVISLSLGHFPAESYYLDAFARGSFLAMKHGILTVAAAGNEGPKKQTVMNVAPWILTVGASTSTTKFETVLEVDKIQYKGSSINPFDSKTLPFICYSPKLKRKKKFHGKIVYCDNLEEMELAKLAGASGIVFRDGIEEPYAMAYDNVPFVWVNYRDATKISRYLRERRRFEVRAKILKSVMVNEPCQVVDFSGRGPNSITPEILKPDLIAPGVEICVPSLDIGKYTVVDGTSFACPYVAGKAALIKRAFEKDNLKPSPAQIHSALVTSASHLTTGKSDVFAQGAGLVNPMNALVPGLVYDRDEDHYTKFLNGQGYTKSKKKKLNCSSCVTEKIEASELNYPTITIVVPKDKTQYSKSIPRRVTCLGTTSCRYQAKVKIDGNIEGNTIEVKPETLHFDEKIREKEFTVLFDVNKEYWTTPVITASLQWISEKDESGKNHIVKSPIVIYCQ